jgi:hypothetical protein
MVTQLAEAEYEAGRHALRLLDPAAARGHLARAARSGPRGWRALPWWGIAQLPRPALAALRGRLGADPSPAEASGSE